MFVESFLSKTNSRPFTIVSRSSYFVSSKCTLNSRMSVPKEKLKYVVPEVNDCNSCVYTFLFEAVYVEVVDPKLIIIVLSPNGEFTAYLISLVSYCVTPYKGIGSSKASIIPSSP
jgi:hypothetical protein